MTATVLAILPTDTHKRYRLHAQVHPKLPAREEVLTPHIAEQSRKARPHSREAVR